MPGVSAEVDTERTQYIGGQWRRGEGAPLTVVNPATEAVIAEVATATAAQVGAAVAAARGASAAWARTPPPERAAALRRIADALEANEERLAESLMAEIGKPRRRAHEDVRNSAAYLRYMAEWDRRIEGEIPPSDNANEAIHLLRVPLGVVAAITAWNYPLDLMIRKVAPALITGNTVIVKPTELAPLTTLAAVRIVAEQADLPPGVLNLVTGGGDVGQALVAHPGVDMISMTGHRDTGKRIMAAAAANLTRVSLELGGSAPAIVLPDADLDRAVEALIFSRFENAGQVCTAAERILVHDEVHDAFVERYVAAAARLRVGLPEDDPDLGPLVSREQREKVRAAVSAARAGGATVRLGGERPQGPDFDKGFWFSPTVLTDVPLDGSSSCDEIFGPVAAISRVADIEQAIAVANGTRYGLSAFLFSESYRTVMQVADRLACGELYINRAMGEALQGFHTGHKESGIGGEDGRHGVLKYTQIKTVYHSYG